MAMHPEVASWMIAGGMVNAVRAAAQHATDRRDQRALDAWSSELYAARDEAESMGKVAAYALRQVDELEGQNEDLRDEVARLRTLLASRNALIRKITQ